MDINRDNYESFLLSGLDGELTQADKESVEKFLSENTDLQKEVSALKTLRLIPDEICFDNKQLLLRTEEKRRVLPAYWLRMTAVLMLGMAGTWLLWNNLEIRKFENLKIERHEKDEKVVNNLKIRKIEKLKMEGNEKGERIAGSGTNVKIRKIEKLKMERNGKDEKIGKLEKKEIEVGESAEAIADIQKSTINTTPETTPVNPVNGTREISTPEIKIPSLVAGSATVPENNSNMVSTVSQPTNESEDVSISVLSLSAKNKPITGFFKKILKNTGSDKSGRTVNVSVLQISY